MKFAKTIIVATMMLGMGSLANAASVFQTTTLYTTTADALDIVFEWNGTPSSGLETLGISPLLPTWNIQLKTNPQPPDATAGIFVKPTHGGNPDAAGRTSPIPQRARGIMTVSRCGISRWIPTAAAR